ncbi:MAG: hypothetical protein GWN99_13800 [Gemmatimonadetes bacterium]|nr:hypothetical protein [Gemmatimonadota bacterium]NIS02120.1 hypothetical protein [Gemmatimonadota bacterium]NIT67945.1 hypothetical protein [Gemmatimonadota bacterium]NIU53939.1 hypothetical protein [Gemmatimonadota bacterium]NIW76529.1 hypothetical protein [Gemmatimonadota bacterium]
MNVTDREGYDNQPHFLSDGNAFLYTSARDTFQTDIYRYDLSSGSVTRVTRTASASEYSPTVMPAGDAFSVIREDGTIQQLWRYSLEGEDRGGLLDALQPVGYHAWGDETTVAVFIVGDSLTPSRLVLADVVTGDTTRIAENIGRSLHRIPGRHAVSFVQKTAEEDEGDWLIKALDLDTRSVSAIAPTLPGREDYVWLPDGSILMGDDSELHRWTAARGWELVADLSGSGVRGITRLAVSPAAERIAVVAERGAADE